MFCCGSSTVKPSAAELKYYLKENEEENIDNLLNDITPTRQKLKPSSNQSNPHIGEGFELRLFSSELCWKNGNIYDYQSQLLSTGNKSFIYYELVNSNSGSAPPPRSTLVSVLRNTVLLTPIAFNVANIWTMLTHSFHAFNKHVEAYQQSFSVIRFPTQDNRLKSPTLTQPSPPSFTSLEHVFMIGDILLAAFVNNFDESMELSALDKPSLLQEISQLLVQLNNLLLVAPEDSRRSCAIAFSQATMKLLQLLFVFLKHIQWNLTQASQSSSTSDRFTTYLRYIHEVVDLFPAINQTMSFLKSHCGEESLHYYINTMLLWSTYEYYLSLIIQLELLFHEMTYKQSMRLLQNKLITCLMQVLPSAQDLLSEIKRMEQYQQSSSGGTTLNKNITSQQQKEDSNLSNWIRVLLNKDQIASSRWQFGSSYYSSTGGTGGARSAGSENMDCIFTFRFRHLLLGLLKYITLYIPLTLSTIPLSQQLQVIQRPNFPNKEETFVLLYEVFSYLLPFGKTDGGMMTTTNQPLMHCLPFLTNLMLKLSLSIRREPSVRWIYWSLAQKLMKFNERLRLYFNSLLNIALMDTALLRESYQHGGVMMESNNDLVTTGRGATASPAMMASPTFTTPKRRVSYSNNVHSVDSHSTSHKNVTRGTSTTNSNTSTNQGGNTQLSGIINTTSTNNSSNHQPPRSFSPLDVALETPFKGLNSGRNDESSSAATNKTPKANTANVYKLDDLVDGLCTLPNGSKRWFPGKVIEIIPRLQGDFLYSILYNDGEIGKEKPSEEIRLTKIRNHTRKKNDQKKQPQEEPQLKPVLVKPETKETSIIFESNKEVRENKQKTEIANGELLPTTLEVASFDFDHPTNPLDDSLNSNEMLLSPPSEAAGSPNESPTIIRKKPSGQDKNHHIPTTLPSKSNKSKEEEIDNVEPSLFTRSFDAKVVVEPDDEDGIGENILVEDDLEGTSGEESEEDRIFEIPSIFDQQRQNHRHLEDVVPRMQFTNLPITSALPQIGSSPSLSSSLLAETTPSDTSMFGGFHSARKMSNDFLYVTPGSGRKFSARSIGNNSSNALTAGISFQKSNSNSNNNANNGTNTGMNSALGTSRSHQAALTNRSEFDFTTIPNSSRSIPQGRRTPNRRRSLSNQTLDDYNQSGKLLISASVNANSMHSISRETSMLSLIHTRSNMINTATTVLSSGMNSVRSTPGLDPYDRHLHNNTPFYFAGIEQLEVLLETFTIVVMMLLSYTFHPVSGEFDYNCCSHHPDMTINTEEMPVYNMLQRLSSKSGDSLDSGGMKEIKGSMTSLDTIDSTQMNSVFIIREFMELTYLTQPVSASLTTTNYHQYSSSQLPSHYHHQASCGSPPATTLRSPPAPSILSPGQQLLHPSTIHSLATLQSTIMKSLTQFILYLNPTNEMLRLSKLLHPYYFLHSKLANYLTPLNKFEKQYSQDSYETELNKIGEGAFGTVYRFTIIQKEEERVLKIEGGRADEGKRPGEEKDRIDPILKPSAVNTSPLQALSSEKSVKSYWDSFSQYSHCFSCYRREHYYLDETNHDDYWDQSSSDMALPFDGSLPLEFSRTQGSLAIHGSNARASFCTTGTQSEKEYVFCQCWKSQFHPRRISQKSPKVTKKVYAVKKLMRERSIHDLSMLYNLYQEILCLEKLSECIGICGIEDYGLSSTSQEYILILENGFMNILDWRQHYLLYKNQLYSFYTQERMPILSAVASQPMAAAVAAFSVTNQQLPATAFSPVNGARGSKILVPELMMEKVTNVSRSSFNNNPNGSGRDSRDGSTGGGPTTTSAVAPSPALLRSTVSLSLKSYHEILSYYHQQSGKTLEGIMEWDCLLFFHLYYEMILIIQYIHSQKIIHFDIKLANFVLRDNPIIHLSYLQYMHGLGKPSGILFLTDFGEAMFNIEDCTNKRILQKSRGTMPIQSPEMLSISESQTHHHNNNHNSNHHRGSSTGVRPHRLRVEGDEGDPVSGTGGSMKDDRIENENVLQRKPLFLQTPEEIQRTENNFHQRTLTMLSSGASVTSASQATGKTSQNKKSIQFPLPSYASDIWSVGCLFFELLSGEMIFQQQSFPELYTKLCLQVFPAPPSTTSSSTTSFVIEAIDQFLLKNQIELQQLRRGSHKVEETTTNTANTPSTLSFPKDGLNRLLLDIMQQLPSNRLSLTEILQELKKIMDEYNETMIVKLQVSEKNHHYSQQHQPHHQQAAKKWKDFYQSQGTAPSSASQKLESFSKDDQERVGVGGGGGSLGGLPRIESDYSSGVFQTADSTKEKNDPPVTTSPLPEEVSRGDRSSRLNKDFSPTWEQQITEKSYYTLDLTDEIHTLVTRALTNIPTPNNLNNNNNNKSQGNLSRRSSAFTPAISTSSLLSSNNPPLSIPISTSTALTTFTSPQDCLRFSNYLFFFSDYQFHELLQSLPNLSLLQSMGKNRHQDLSMNHSTSGMAPPMSPVPPALGTNKDSYLSMNSANNYSSSGGGSNYSMMSHMKSYYDLEEKHQYHFDQFLSSNHIPMTAQTTNATHHPQSMTSSSINSNNYPYSQSKKLLAQKRGSPRANKRLPEEMNTTVTLNPNAVLLTPNYQLFSANLALEQLLRYPSGNSRTGNVTSGQMSPSGNETNNNNNNNLSHPPPANTTTNAPATSTIRDLRRASNSSSTRSLPVDILGSTTALPVITPVNHGYHWMEVIPSLLLKDLLSHYQYYSLEASSKNISSGSGNGNSSGGPTDLNHPHQTYSTPRKSQGNPSKVSPKHYSTPNHHDSSAHYHPSSMTSPSSAMIASASTTLQKITPLPIVGIYLRFELVTTEMDLNDFLPKVECSKHPLLSNIFFYTLFIPILIEYPTDTGKQNIPTTTTTTEERDKADHNNPEIKLHISVEKMIQVLKDFLLNYFIPTYAHHYHSSGTTSTTDEINSSFSMKPLVFLFSGDAYRAEEERDLRKFVFTAAVPFARTTSYTAAMNHNSTSPHRVTSRKEGMAVQETKEDITGEGVASSSSIEDRIHLQRLLIVAKLWMTIQQMLNSGRLVLSGFITRYLQEDLLGGAVSAVSSREPTVTAPSLSHSGDALQSILQSILTFIRYLPLATSNPVYDYQYEGKNELKSPLTQPSSPFNQGIGLGGGGNGTILTASSSFSYSMPLIERLLYFFFASLQVDYSVGASSSITGLGPNGLPTSPMSPLLPRGAIPTLTDGSPDHPTLARTASQLKRIASIRNVLLSSVRTNPPYHNTAIETSITRNSYPFSSLRKGQEISRSDLLGNAPPHLNGGNLGEGIHPQTSRSSNNSRLDTHPHHPHHPYQPQESLFAFLSRSGSDFMHHMFALAGNESSHTINTSQKSKKRKPLPRKRATTSNQDQQSTNLWSSFWKQF